MISTSAIAGGTGVNSSFLPTTAIGLSALQETVTTPDMSSLLGSAGSNALDLLFGNTTQIAAQANATSGMTALQKLYSALNNPTQPKPIKALVKRNVTQEYYKSTSVLDDVALAATWMYIATGEPNFLGDAQRYIKQHESAERIAKGLGQTSAYYISDWDNSQWSVYVLLAKLTDLAAYHSNARDFLRTWTQTKPISRSSTDAILAVEAAGMTTLNNPNITLPEAEQAKQPTYVTSATDEAMQYQVFDMCVPDFNTSNVSPSGQPLPVSFEDKCDDGIDNDCNGLTDDQDPSCALSPVQASSAPQRLAWSHGATLPNTASAAFLSLVYSSALHLDSAQSKQLKCWSMGQLQYMLGDNPNSQSYIVGYDGSSPKRVQMMESTCPVGNVTWTCDYSSGYYPGVTNVNLAQANGALVYGPNKDDSFPDDRTAPNTRFSTMGNAAFSEAVAGIDATGTNTRVCGQLQGLYQALFVKSSV